MNRQIEKLQQETALSTNGAGTAGHHWLKIHTHTHTHKHIHKTLKTDHGLTRRIIIPKLLGRSLAV